MGAAKHTPGPWTWEEGQGDIKREWNGCAWAVARVSGCQLGWHEDRTCEGREAGANARLIAAAPELLEAARKAREALAIALAVASPDLFGTDADIAEHLTIKALDAAIAKATGSAS